jgi:TatD DNase family protein
VIDTHAHLDAGEDDPVEVLTRAREAGVTRVIAVGSGIDSSRAALDVAEREPGVYAALGIHPHQAGGAEAQRVDELRDLLASPRAVAVGETGLDHYRDYAPRDRQRGLFDAQLRLAAELGKPVVVHTRAADAETVDALEGFGGTVVLHCFSSPGLLDPALEHGWYVSFAGNVTYPNAAELADAAERVPLDRLLVETDAPYLTPQERRKERNRPAYVVHTARFVAERRGLSYEELEAAVDANAARLFGW